MKPRSKEIRTTYVASTDRKPKSVNCELTKPKSKETRMPYVDR